MRPPRRRVDNTQADIVEAFRVAGASVWLTHHVGNGAPDLVVGWGLRVMFPVECKTGSEGLTLVEEAWHREWRGVPVEVVRSPEEAISVLRRHIQGER